MEYIQTFDNQKRKNHPSMIPFLKQQYVAENATAPPPESATGEPVHAFINHGMWLAFCPHLPCRSALFVSKVDRVFLCTNVECEDQCWHEVIFPEDHLKIEAILLERPDRRNRNWNPDETLDDLREENEAHGIVSATFIVIVEEGG